MRSKLHFGRHTAGVSFGLILIVHFVMRIEFISVSTESFDVTSDERGKNWWIFGYNFRSQLFDNTHWPVTITYSFICMRYRLHNLNWFACNSSAKRKKFSYIDQNTRSLINQSNVCLFHAIANTNTHTRQSALTALAWILSIFIDGVFGCHAISCFVSTIYAFQIPIDGMHVPNDVSPGNEANRNGRRRGPQWMEWKSPN